MPLTVRAFAKLNLTLEVLSRRLDGYHEVASVLQTVSLADVISFQPASYVSVITLGAAIPEKENLVTRAVYLMQKATGVAHGIRIRVQKKIPLAAGLGGGSADAAATLWALNRLWQLNLPLEALQQVAAGLGSDVPFFLAGGTALATGQGEVLQPLPAAVERWFLILHPPVDLPNKTAAMYAHLQARHWTSGRVTKELTKTLETSGRIREAYLFNAFDAVAFDLLPDLHDWRRRLLEIAPSRPHVAGAGPSLFIPLEDEAQGGRVVDALRSQEEGPEQAACFVVRTVPAARELLEDV